MNTKNAILWLIGFVLLVGCREQPKTRTVYASEWGIVLNSDVYRGGGTDMTDELQALLDKAPQWGRLHLILDGAALISRPLDIHSNTTIECPDKSCGLFLADSSNCCVVRNANRRMDTIIDHNITLIGGVYNNNSPGQVHHRDEEPDITIVSNMVFGMEFYGVAHVGMRDVTIANQRTWAMVMANWKYVAMDDIHIDRRERADAQNQDGLHFLGPGRFLTLRNIYGNAGDDFIALAPDESDLKSNIEDVLIDGVHLEEADQGIRLLSREAGKLDRVIIRNVTGTYRSYGFVITPWYDEGHGGHYGNIVFDMIDLRPMKNNYTYVRPFLFKLGGNIESMTLKNIYHHTPAYDHTFCVVGGHYVRDVPSRADHLTRIDRLMIDGLYVDERDENSVPQTYIDFRGAEVGLLSVKDVIMRRADGLPKTGSLIKVRDSHISEVILHDISAPCLNQLTDAPAGSIGRLVR